MKDGIYRVTTSYLCAGFVVAGGDVVACAPILRKKLAYWRTVAVRVALVLLMAVPAFGQTVVFRGTGDNRSEYGTPSPDRNVICPVCEEASKKSTVRRWPEYSTTLSFSPSFNERTEARYWDEDGKYHDHELGEEVLVCSSGHRFLDYDDRRCWCGFPGERYVVLDEVKGDTLILPSVTRQDLLVAPAVVVAPASYQHPFIQPELTLPAAAVDGPSVNPPESEKFDRSFWIVSGLWFGASTADLVTTKFALDRGGVESNPLHAQDGGHKLRWPSAIAATGGTFAFAAYCERKGHRRVARIVLITGAIVRTGLAFWNNSRRR